MFSFLTFTLTGIYTAQGDSKTPFAANLVGLLMNMILDPVLILGLGPFPALGVTGAAIATVTAQFVVMSILILGIVLQKKENALKGIQLFAKIPAEHLRGICKIGIPTALQGMAYCMISMVLTRMVSGFGAEAIATQRVGGQIESISWNTADGFASALNAFIGQNYGAGEMDRVKKGYKASLWTVGIWGILISLAFILFPEPISRVFFHEEAAIAVSVGYTHDSSDQRSVYVRGADDDRRFVRSWNDAPEQCDQHFINQRQNPAGNPACRNFTGTAGYLVGFERYVHRKRNRICSCILLGDKEDRGRKI